MKSNQVKSIWLSAVRLLRALKWWNTRKALVEFELANHKNKIIFDSFKKIKSWNILGSYMEFGVYKGQSIVFAAKNKETLFGSKQEIINKGAGISGIFAFDSFDGIKGIVPEESSGPFREGGYAASYNEFIKNLGSQGVSPDEIVTIPGYFQDSLTSTLQSELISIEPVVAVVNIDCDVYVPALLALDFVRPMLRQGSIVLFDDWFSYALDPLKGEPRALSEFLQKNPSFRFEFWQNYGPVGRAFIVVISQ